MLVVGVVAYRVLTKVHHEANPASDDHVYETIARGVWRGELPPADFSPGLAPFLALFANPWTSSEVAFGAARGVLALLLAWCVHRALRRRAGAWIALCAALWIVAGPMPYARFIVRPAAALVVAGALAAAARPARERGAAALVVLAAGTWLRPELGLAAVVLLVLQRLRGPVAARTLLAAGLLMGSALLYQGLAERRYEDRFFRAFAQHYAWGAGERGAFDGDPWDGWRPLVAADFGAELASVPAAARAAPRAFGRHLLHNAALLPREALKAQAPLGARRGAWCVVALVVAVGLGCVLRRSRTRGAGRATHALQGASGALLVLGASATMLLPWMVVRPRADVLFALAPGFVFVLGLSAAYAAGVAAERETERGEN